MEDTVYHYCSMSTFISIMRNRSIWLTTLRDSNDAFEGTWARRKFLSLHKSPTTEYFKKASQILDAATHSGKDIAGICLSAEKDLLSQWRGYADDGRGLCIGFSSSRLTSLAKKISENTGIKIEYSEIEYLDRLDDEFLREFKVFVDKQACSSSDSFASLQIDNVGLQHWVRRVSLMKNVAFKEERESRLYCLYPDRDFNGFEYRVAGSKLSPYLELSLKEDLNEIIRSVVIGPKNTSDDSQLRDFVAKSGFSKVCDVSKSRASYR
jgi:hypothetical protein